jgi:hypothetical protein
MTKSKRKCDHFVFDGPQRHEAVIAPEICACVVAEFADRLHEAGPLERLWLRYLVRREIDRRLPEAVSPYSLY